MPTVSKLIVTIALGTTAMTGCGSDQPSTSEWAADVIKICKQLEVDRQASAARDLPADSAPTIEQLMAFSADFAPIFARYATQMKAVARPDGHDTEIDELFTATDVVVAATQNVATDRAAAQAVLETDGPAPSEVRLEAAATALGLDECNDVFAI